MGKVQEVISLRNPTTRRTLLTGVAFILGFIVFAVVGIQLWEYTNSTPFCSNACHDVHPEEPVAYQDSYHARVACVECHMGRVGMLEAFALKASHSKHLPATLLGQYGRPLKAETLRPANESCEKCHWPPAFHGDTVRESRRFLPDETNTERQIYLILKTGGGQRERGLGYGIHWHIENPVEYIATDEPKQSIPWVRTTLPDGKTVEYNDVIDPLTPGEIAQSEIRVMDCVDCHNRVGHPFPYPEQAIDRALAEGKLGRDLPFAKKEMLDLLGGDYATQEEALEAVGTAQAQYEAAHPDIAAKQGDDIEQAARLAEDLVTLLVFEEPGVTWESFPDNSGHKEFPGCFRCHDGKHLSPEGESIRLHCNICHSVPVIVGEGDRPPAMPVVSIQEPASHQETNFMADHRFQANENCTTCHGEVAFGSDDSGFCANSACHGQPWPLVELDAAFPHPIALSGKHTEVWCHDCHEGVEKPSYRCANCHEPPTTPHFGDVCEDCHTPEGFEEATLPPELHPVPLVGNHLNAACESCHTDSRPDPEYICSECHQPPENHLGDACDTCHAPEGWADSAAILVAHTPGITHGLQGLGQCLICHDPAQDTEPVPESHVDAAYVNEQCQWCHEASP